MAKTQSSSSSSSSALIWYLNEDLLWEVFLHQPHRRSLIQCSLVCKQWRSVIIKTQFTQQFIKERSSYSSSYSLPYSISFFSAYHKCTFFGQILSKKSKILLGKQPESGLYQNIWPENVRIRASCDDLLLISQYLDFGQRYGICNPLTRHLHWLPDDPILRQFRKIRYLYSESCGFICELRNDLYRFKVLIYKNSYVHENDHQRNVLIFCSETWKWSNLILSFPQKVDHVEDFVSSNGILYAPENGGNKRFVEINLAVDDCNPKLCPSIDPPNEFAFRWRGSGDNVCYGVVRGKLRLAQMLFMFNTEEYELKVWELMDIDNNWVLMHSIRLRQKETTSNFLAAFHPYNGNVIFISHNHEIYEYEIKEQSDSPKIKRVCELRGPGLPSRKDLREIGWRFFNAFPLVYPPWPTSIPISPNV